MPSPPTFTNTGIVSFDPLVTYTTRHTPTPLGLPGGCPELFAGRKSLHFIQACWQLDPADTAEIAGEWRRVTGLLPEAMIVFLAPTDYDVARLSKAGVPTLLCNTTIFVNEQIFRPLPPFDFADAAYDAIYNARFEPYKRHEFARAIESLALLYDAPFAGGDAPLEPAIRKMLPHARFLNHEFGGGRYLALGKDAISRAVNRARCALCLSAVEGVMRASMEYLMCGIPVVSTHSVGGRERYYQEPYAIVVPDDAEAVRDAVAEIKRRKLNKLAIRDHVGRIVEFERRNFLRAVNELAHAHFGVEQLFETLAPFVKAEPFTAPLEDWSRRKIIPLAEALGVKLPPPARSQSAESAVST